MSNINANLADDAGISVQDSSGNIFYDMNLSGIYMIGGSNNNTFDNITINSPEDGVILQSSSNNTFEDIALISGGDGFNLQSSSINNTFDNITINSSGNGIYADRLSSNNNLMAVTVDSASYGIAISSIGNSMINSNISGSSFLNFDASPSQFVNLSNDTVDYSYEMYYNSLFPIIFSIQQMNQMRV